MVQVKIQAVDYPRRVGWLVVSVLILIQVQAASPAESIELITRSTAASHGITGDGHSGSPTISSNGRFVLFVSSANNLVTNHENGADTDLYLRDRMTRATTLISVNQAGTGGANAPIGRGDMSEDGRWVVFDSHASNLVPGDFYYGAAIFLRDTLLGQTILISHQYGTTNRARGDSSNPVISADGRFIAFQSTATNLQSTAPNLAPNQAGPLRDIFLYDRASGAIQIASPTASDLSRRATCENPVISADGRFVAFAASGVNLITGAITPTVPLVYREVYLYDRLAEKLIWASSNIVAITKLYAPATSVDCFQPALSADGRFLAFQSWNGSTNGSFLTLRFNVALGTLDVVRTDAGSAAAWQSMNRDGPILSADGDLLLYSMSTNLFIWNAATLSNSVVNLDFTGANPATGTFSAASMSDDGRLICFSSDSTNLALNASTGTFQIYLRDMQTGSTSLISTNQRGEPLAGAQVSYPLLSADGNQVVFDTADREIVPNDENLAMDVFCRDTRTGDIDLISEAHSSVQSTSAAGRSFPAIQSISENGRFLVFTSFASDLATNRSFHPNIYIRDLQTQSTTLVSVGMDGDSSANAPCTDPVISAGGRFVAFSSLAGNLTPNDANGWAGVFVRDLEQKKTILVSLDFSRSHNGSGNSTKPSISDDGSFIAFQSSAKDLVQANTATVTDIFVWEAKNQTITLASVDQNGNAPGFAQAISPLIRSDGTWVAFGTFPTNNSQFTPCWVKNLKTGVLQALPASLAVPRAPLVFIEGNDSILYQGLTAKFYMLNLATGVSETVCTNCVELSASRDGRFVVFLDSLRPLPSRLYVSDRASTNTIVISSFDPLTSVGRFHHPSISSNGRFVLFENRGTQSEMLGMPLNAFTEVLLYDRASARTWLASGATGDRARFRDVSSFPGLSLARGIVTFQSFSDTIVQDDRNQTSDLFLWQLPLEALDLRKDSDADGLDDAWELKHFGNLFQTAWDDPDGDGIVNLDEFRTGSYPVKSFRIIGAALTGASIRLSWLAEPGKRYQLQFKDQLDDPVWSPVAGDVVAASDAVEKSDDLLATTQRFYRILLLP